MSQEATIKKFNKIHLLKNKLITLGHQLSVATTEGKEEQFLGVITGNVLIIGDAIFAGIDEDDSSEIKHAVVVKFKDEKEMKKPFLIALLISLFLIIKDGKIMKNTKILIVILSVLLFSLAGCGEKEVCDTSKKPSYTFLAGEKAVFKDTGEQVRVVSEWTLLGGGRCREFYYAKYTIRFLDGAEIAVEWNKLKKTS